MSISRLGWPTLVMLVCCVAAAVAVSRASEKQPLTKLIEHDPAALAIPGVLGDAPPLDVVVAEIIRLREQQGDDKLLESDVFEPLPLDSKIVDRQLQLSATPPARATSPQPAVCLVSSPSGSLQITDQVEALRESARHMDEVAHILECHDRYSRADEVRTLATQLRQDARLLLAYESLSTQTIPTARFDSGLKRGSRPTPHIR